MTVADLPVVKALADAIHPDFPEGEAVFADRLALHAAGCLVLPGESGIAGYVISHPWHVLQPPTLDTCLGALPASPSTYYIHDLALHPAMRRTGAATAAVEGLAAHATALGLRNITLVAVNDSVHFWRRRGFEAVADPRLDCKLRSYGEHAIYMSRALPSELQQEDDRDET